MKLTQFNSTPWQRKQARQEAKDRATLRKLAESAEIERARRAYAAARKLAEMPVYVECASKDHEILDHPFMRIEMPR